jgi:hypothetical protein
MKIINTIKKMLGIKKITVYTVEYKFNDDKILRVGSFTSASLASLMADPCITVTQVIRAN